MKQPLTRLIQRPSPAAPGRALVECSVFFRLLPGLIVLPVLLAALPPAFAQSNTVPGPTDYAAFSRFIAERNIFDPNRTPRDAGREPAYHPRVSRTAPVFTLVGTMSYAKGMFAFFNGNQPDLRKVLYTTDSNSIAGFTVADITLSGVTLQSADKKQTVELKIGDSMRQEDNVWRRVPKGELPVLASAGTEETTAAGHDASHADAAPLPAGAANDILKRLMEQREQELK